MVIITAVWKQFSLTELVLDRFNHIKSEISNKINLELVAVGSEGIIIFLNKIPLNGLSE